MVTSERIEDSAGPAGEKAVPQPPLAVDLDGTLVKTDLLIESSLALLRKQPLCIFFMPLWALRGKAAFKGEVAQRVSLEISLLPWRSELIEYLTEQRARGRIIVLATGSDLRIARQAADHLKLFDLVLGTEGSVNLSGIFKRDLLVRHFGNRGFDYAADGGGMAQDDLVVWGAARKAILVNAGPRVLAGAGPIAVVDRVFRDSGDGQSGFTARLRALRPSQWLKNLLVFVPVIAAHRVDVNSLVTSLLAFAAFSCCASAGYLFNDLMDLDADRHHPLKRTRPFASGALPLTWALGMIPFLLVSGCALGLLVSPLFTLAVLLYFAMSTAYTLRIKTVAILDVLFLAGLYTVRILAGSVAVGIWLSHWLLAFSIFLFFSLALVKRYAELVIMRRIDHEDAKARAYEVGDGELLASMGTASGYLAVLVLALYIASDKAQALYQGPAVLWLLCPLLLYWISHVWLTAHRGNMTDDPIAFATTDRTSRILAAAMLATAVIAGVK
jgi:4-hydroxybenzoate polyprenyltransferase